MKAILIVSLVIVFLLTPLFLMLFLNQPIFYFEYKSIEMQVFTQEEYLSYTKQIIQYIFNDKGEIEVRDALGSKIEGFFSSDEIQHMIDVKKIFRAAFILYVFSVALCFLLRRRVKKEIINFASSISLIFLGFLLIAALTNFDQAFTVFHRIFFRNELWLLPEDSSLIRLLPEKVFFDLALIWFSSSTLISLLAKVKSRKLTF